MSAGPGVAEGAAPGPAPTRSRALAELARELWHARDVHEDRYAAELERRIARLSQGSPHNPSTETTAAGRRPAARTRRKT